MLFCSCLRMSCTCRSAMVRAVFLLLFTLVWNGSVGWAGLSSSDVVVVVNGESFNSRTLANHYVALRKIPAVNVVVLDRVPSSELIGVEEFRSRILKPLFSEIDRRGLSGHVQCIAYSADFPSAIDVSEDLKKRGRLQVYETSKGSINALTYLHMWVNSSVPGYVGLEVNHYARREVEHYFSSPFHGDSAPWGEIQAKIAQKEHQAAVDALEAVLKEHPHQFPVAYLAAAEAALAGDSQRSVQLLTDAIGLGWSLGGYLARDKRFDSVRDDPGFQVLEFTLPQETDVKHQPMQGFDARTYWTPNGVGLAPKTGGEVLRESFKFGNRYLLSTVLGITRRGGTSLPQAIEALHRAASADFTHPQGGFYFCSTDDIRTKTRRPGFSHAVDLLRQMGFEASIVTDRLPKNRPSVLGVQAGTPTFDWKSCGSQFVPGALAENLTSLGGVIGAGGRQTRLTEFIKAGAAGSSGSVTEPYALQQKFPHSQMYVYYASGASLAEAFYMSVRAPYQLLIVGDPLCQPFSNAPRLELGEQLRELKAGGLLRLDLGSNGVEYQDWLDFQEPISERRQPFVQAKIGVLFDGSSYQLQDARKKLSIQMEGSSPGYHEVTLSLVADDPLQQRSDVMVPIWIGEKGLVDLTFPDQIAPRKADAADMPQFSLRSESLTVHVESEQAKRVTLWHDSEQVGMAEGQQADFRIGLKDIGLGPVRLQAKAETHDGLTVQGVPVWIEIGP